MEAKIDQIYQSVFEPTAPLSTSSINNCDSPFPICNLSSELTILTPQVGHYHYRHETVIMTEPEICLTTEETNFIADLKSKHSLVCKRSFPLRWGHGGLGLSQIGLFCSLNVARVEKYLGLPTKDDDVFSFFTAGRRAENLFHYNAMRSLPGFEELTIRYWMLL